MILDEIDAQLAPLRDKYGALARRFADRTDCKRVLFVRSWREILHAPLDYPEHTPAEASPYPFDRLIAALEAAAPTADFKVLFLNYGAQMSDDPRAVHRNIRNHGDSTDWTGSRAGWDEMFNSLHGP